jgi:hypothetical protein
MRLAAAPRDAGDSRGIVRARAQSPRHLTPELLRLMILGAPLDRTGSRRTTMVAPTDGNPHLSMFGVNHSKPVLADVKTDEIVVL